MKYKIPTIKWNKICNQIHMTKKKTTTKKHTIIFRFIYVILPRRDHLVKHKILKQIPPYTMCKKDFYSFKHNFT